MDSFSCPPARQCPLSNRQLEVVRWLSDGHAADVVAEIMQISLNTLQRHIADAKDASGAANTAGLVAMSLRKGWIQ